MLDKILNNEKFIGKIFWISPNIFSIASENKTTTQAATITRAIKIGDKFTLEWSSKEFGNGGIKLFSSDNFIFSGQFNYEDMDYSVTGLVSGKLYMNNGSCLLIGKWIEEGDEFTFIIELNRIDKFHDQK
jgi:hypothetical protein